MTLYSTPCFSPSGQVQCTRKVHINFFIKLEYLKDSNAAAHSADSDKFYVVINVSLRDKSSIITFLS